MKCPICKQERPPLQAGDPDEFFPFCSDRCKLIDLGRWLDGKYQIPVEATDELHDGDAGKTATED